MGGRITGLYPNMVIQYWTPWSKQGENGNPWFWVGPTFEWYEGVTVFRVSFKFFFFRTNGKNTWTSSTSVTVMVIVLKVPFWKLLAINYNCVQSSFSAVTRQINNGIWKAPYSWRFYGQGSIYELILSWINIMRPKWAKVDIFSCKIIWACSLKDISLIIVFFFLSQRNAGARLLLDAAGGLLISSGNPLNFHAEIWSLLAIVLKYL